MPVKIAIIFCNDIIGIGLRKIVEEHLFEVSAVSLSLENVNTLFEIKPNLLICDYHSLMLIPEKKIKASETSVLLIGSSCVSCITDGQLLELVSFGVAGILPENGRIFDFIKAIKSILGGELWFDRKRLRTLLSNVNRSKRFEPDRLTKREKEIVRLICNGYRNKKIMNELSLSEQSVKSHLNRINKKFGVSDRLQLAVHVMREFPGFLKIKDM